MGYDVVRSEVTLWETETVDLDGAGLEETLFASDGSERESGRERVTYRNDIMQCYPSLSAS